MMVAAAPLWTGTLRRDGDTLRGIVRDRWHWEVELVIRRGPDGSYQVEGWLGETPLGLRLDGEDENRNPIDGSQDVDWAVI
jgi:hypothetical protein